MGSFFYDCARPGRPFAQHPGFPAGFLRGYRDLVLFSGSVSSLVPRLCWPLPPQQHHPILVLCTHAAMLGCGEACNCPCSKNFACIQGAEAFLPGRFRAWCSTTELASPAAADVASRTSRDPQSCVLWTVLSAQPSFFVGARTRQVCRTGPRLLRALPCVALGLPVYVTLPRRLFAWQCCCRLGEASNPGLWCIYILSFTLKK